jgi:hypothetical protein
VEQCGFVYNVPKDLRGVSDRRLFERGRRHKKMGWRGRERRESTIKSL